MGRIKIIFFDIDGTLLNPQTGCISEKTVQALNALKENGIILCVATGRPTVSLPDFKGLPFDVFLTFNGSLCYTEKETIFSNPISTQDVRNIIQNAASIGRPVSLALKDRLAANGMDKDLSDYYTLASLELSVAEDFETVCEEEVYQVMLGCREEDHEDIVRGVDAVKIAVSWDRAVDVIPANAGKGSGIRKVLEYYHLEPSEALAFGDNNNDIEMLQAVGTGVAMGNATEQLKAVADEVCGSVFQDGIYHYCIEKNIIFL